MGILKKLQDLSEFWKDLKWIVTDTGIQGGDII